MDDLMQERIKHMALQAGLIDYISKHDQWIADAGPISEQLTRFARIVAEDCASLVDGNAAQCSGMTAELMHSNADTIRARYAETKEG